jgi:hypothetical protein
LTQQLFYTITDSDKGNQHEHRTTGNFTRQSEYGNFTHRVEGVAAVFRQRPGSAGQHDEVALQMSGDNKAQIESWLVAGMVGKVSDEQAAAWLATAPEVWAVVVSPWVLVQEIVDTTHS